MRPTGRLLFYSTSRTNQASQAVAARLRLRSIGWLWQLRRRQAESGWIDPRLRGGPSIIEGSGLCASAPIRAGEVVFVWGGGRIIMNADLHAIAASRRRYSSAAIGEDQNILWDVVDADAGGPGGANHSCDPNLWMQVECTVCARRDIAVGEELTMDYALATVSPDWRMECYCGAELCRGVVTGTDWQLPDLQQRYAGHFSPFINARIAARRGTHSMYTHMVHSSWRRPGQSSGGLALLQSLPLTWRIRALRCVFCRAMEAPAPTKNTNS